MKILLVNPWITSRRSARFPLSLLALAAHLQGAYGHRIVDGNVDRDYLSAIRRAMRAEKFLAVCVSVMGGPQVRSAIDVSLAIRGESPDMPIVWGGYFPTLYPRAAINASYVDYLVRGQGEQTLSELLDALVDGRARPDPLRLASIDGLTWKRADAAVHNKDRAFHPGRSPAPFPYESLGNARDYLGHTVLGRRTAAHQAALGCRFRCTFCGVAATFRGGTSLPAADRLEKDLIRLRDEIGADSVQYYDHNFFDREAEMVPLLEVLARARMPWWCYARSDALLNLSSKSWALVRKSMLRMAYIGAESPSDTMLRGIRKGTTSNQTLEVVDLCRRHGVIPELSFMVAPPVDSEGETERTFEFVRHIKRLNPASEIIIYVYTPLPAESLPLAVRRHAPAVLTDLRGNPLSFPRTPEEWTERRWIDYSCHADAPWVSERLHRRIRDFVTVLGCRFPTVQDVRTPRWSKSALQALASWRYRFRKYDRPWELELWKRAVRLHDPRARSI